MSDTINLCGLWKNKTKDGNTYLSGTLGNIKIMVFPNQNKKESKHPDYNVVIAPRKDDGKEPNKEHEEEPF